MIGIGIELNWNEYMWIGIEVRRSGIESWLGLILKILLNFIHELRLNMYWDWDSLLK